MANLLFYKRLFDILISYGQGLTENISFYTYIMSLCASLIITHDILILGGQKCSWNAGLDVEAKLSYRCSYKNNINIIHFLFCFYEH